MLVVEVPHDMITSAASNAQSPKEESAHTTTKHDSHVHSDMVASEDAASPKCSRLNSDNMKVVTSVRLDISFKSPSHTGLQTTELVNSCVEVLYSTEKVYNICKVMTHALSFCSTIAYYKFYLLYASKELFPTRFSCSGIVAWKDGTYLISSSCLYLMKK